MSQEVIFIAGKNPFRQLGGHSSYVRAHARAARRLGFEPHVFFIGTDEIAGESDIGIIHPVFREDISDEENALLVEPGDVAEMAAALRRLLLDAELRERLRRRGQELYRSRFSAGALTAAIAELYLSLGFTACSG